MDLKIINVLEEQVAVGFTGKVNVLSRTNRQYLGHLIFKDGEIIQVFFQQARGLKAFFQLIIQEFSLAAYDYVVEPEIVEDIEQQMFLPFAQLKLKIAEVVKNHRESIKFRPPENVKIIIDAEFMEDSLPLTPQEFEVLNTLTEWSMVRDVYRHCQLLEHEITWALVHLRKVGALKILGAKDK